MNLCEILTAWRGGLIVSCQAPAGSPLARPDIIAAFALTAEMNGAVGVRLDGQEAIRATRATSGLPILGIEKLHVADSEVYITPDFASAERVAAAGADAIALDGTERQRPAGLDFAQLCRRIRCELNLPLMADIATYQQGVYAAETAGVDFIGTTLSGYTPETTHQSGVDFKLVEELATRLETPIICEGRLRNSADVRRAFSCGAFAVVVGNAITGIDWLVREFAGATPSRNGK
jgi:N-acylglucosamine-6-phosphate 2-epimerase